MEAYIVDFEGNEAECAKVRDRALSKGHSASQVKASGSNFEALNAPITGAEMIIAAHVIAAGFKAAAAAVVFIKETRDLLGPDQSLKASRSGRQRPITISSATSDHDIEDYMVHDDVKPDDDDLIE
jgi:hypothetical protein